MSKEWKLLKSVKADETAQGSALPAARTFCTPSLTVRDIVFSFTFPKDMGKVEPFSQMLQPKFCQGTPTDPSTDKNLFSGCSSA